MKPALILESFDKKKIVVYAETVNTKLEHHPAYPIAKIETNGFPEDTVRVILSLGFEEEWDTVPEEEEKCLIYGCESAETFELYVNENEIIAKCKDIWDNPDKYSDYKKGSDSAYYQFLKYLWVKFPDNREIRLADLALE